MSDAVGVSFQLGEGVMGAFVRMPGADPIWLSIEDEGRTLDKERPPVIFLGGSEVIDLAEARALSDLMREYGDGGAAFTVSETYVAGRIWHGKSDQGTGSLGRVLQAKGLVARVYYGDYGFAEYALGAEEFESLKSRLRSTFGL